MEICGIQCTKESSSKELIIIDYILENPNIELYPNYKDCPIGYPIKITVQTKIKNTNYASVLYYISKIIIPRHIEKEFYTQLLTYSVENHIESIYKRTLERKPLSFYEKKINYICLLSNSSKKL